MPNFYELLNVKSTASQEELKINYKQLILQYHPDKLQQHREHEQHESSIQSTTTTEEESTDPNMTKKRKKFLAINEAWNTLKDPIKRKLYDAELLQTKFQMHNNVYDTITCNEMRHEVWLLDDDDNDGGDGDGDDDSDKEEKESKKYNENKAKLSSLSVCSTESEVLENYVDDDVRENHVVATATVDDEDNKEITTTAATTTTTRVYYVYDCRCGGQYALDESAYEVLKEGDNNKHKADDKKHSLCRNDKSSSSSNSSNTKSHHHHQQQQQQQQQQQPEKDNNKLKANQKEEKLHRNQQQQKRTSVIMSVDDCKVVSAATHKAYGNGDDGVDVDDCIAKQNQVRNEVVSRGVVDDGGDDDDDDRVEGDMEVEVEVDRGREDNIADNDDEVIVECNECSLVIIVKTANRK